ncbi:HD domain-containing protein [Caloramator sp. Dgby_cultured_2]|uniref:HD domain-containing protein n=1 Tax=Caloramator sp. Dgby_cultured_2 TaxID=3029174 RepID=UPI00237DEAB2|nr:HD domain-containing protein [Caloramator sp. Dgby_cultured_2]WDU82896.1 HD domain-containing protein [Caloramator sp. Dgby_cultured_2]
MLYRVKQFLRAITAKLTEDDYRFINFYLNERERQLFYSLSKSEQYHSINVARCVLETSIKEGCYDIILIKAALLHDIGKIDSGLNPITKSIMVILDKIFSQKLKMLKRIKFIRAYYDHPKIALDYLGNKKNYLAFLIENHHNYNINDRKLKLLQRADCKN